MRRVAWWGLLGLCGVVACGGSDSSPVTGETFGAMPADKVLLDVEHFVTADGVRRAIVRADTTYVFDDSARIKLRRVRVKIFNAQGQETADLTAREGEVEIYSQAMVARGNVVLVTREGDKRIETEELHYDPRQDRIWSDVATTLTEGGTVIHGTGFTSDSRLNVTIHRPSGRVEVPRLEF